MAGIAHIRTVDVPCNLAAGGNTVMTTGAGAQYLTVIHRAGRYRRPGSGKFLMAGVAQIRAIDMTAALAAGSGAIMTRDTVANERGMIRCDAANRCPARCIMAGIAFVGSGYVRGTLAGGDYAIVTTGTHANDLVVIHRRGDYRCPGGELGRGMAGVTDIGTVDVTDIFA